MSHANLIRTSLLSLAFTGGLLARADEPAAPAAPAPEHHLHQVTVNVDGPKEPVTFLGVETAPAGETLTSQLGLTEGTGLVVHRILPGSPAASVLHPHDILLRIDDQILVDQRQLSVLVRGHHAGDEVTLTLFRGGKETGVKVKLGTHEVPKTAGMQESFGFPGMENMDLSELAELHHLPGMGREDVDNMLQQLKRNQAMLSLHPQIRIVAHEGREPGATILNLNQGNVVFSDEQGAVEINAQDGKRELTVKNPKGEVTFKGAVTTEEERKQLPEAVRSRLEQLEKINVGVEPGEDFIHEGSTVGKGQKISAPAAPRQSGPASF